MAPVFRLGVPRNALPFDKQRTAEAKPSSFDIERWIILFDPRRHASVCASRQFDVESRNIRRRGGCCDLLCSVQRLENRGKLNRAPLWQVDPAHMSQLKIGVRSEEHTSELQSLMRPSYAVVCL